LITKLEKQAGEENFWLDNQEAQKVLKNIRDLQSAVDRYEKLLDKALYINDILEMAAAEDEQELLKESSKEVTRLEKEFHQFELEVCFSGAHDENNAILSLHAGAGGTEAQDWVEILLRMYTRWAENSGYGVEILDLLDGDEAGIKSVTVLVSGLYAYGKLKGEHGVPV
jgi:peptide chain release factor 2